MIKKYFKLSIKTSRKPFSVHKFALCLSVVLLVFSLNIPLVRAISPEQKGIYLKGINYFDIEACSIDASSSSVSNLATGEGQPTDLVFPNLEPDAMASAIDKFIDQTNSDSKLSGLGNVIVASAEQANVSPFLIVSIAHMESGLSNPSDYNVRHGNNSFGRQAGDGQPYFKGAGDNAGTRWYEWKSVKASVDYTAQENKNIKGGGDIATYLRNEYGSMIDANDTRALISKYGDNVDTYINDYINPDFKKLVEFTGNKKSPKQLSSGSSVYMVGDSITVGAKNELEAAFKDKNLQPFINGSSSRSITQPGKDPTTSGREAIEGDRARIKNANTIIVALGTNQRDSGINGFKSAMKDMVSKIKEYNNQANIYWVNIFSKGGSDGYGHIDNEAINGVINEVAAKENIQVIDTTKADITVKDSVHPDSEGYKKFVKTVVNGINGNSASENQPQLNNSGCACTTGGPILSGKDNAAKIWNFLIGKGLSAPQVAGMIGNIQAESAGTFDPRVVEFGYPNSKGVTSQAGKPDTWDDEVPPNVNEKGQPGYGIIQWTSPGRKQGLKDLAKEQGTKGGNLGTQLEFLWQELNSSDYKDSVLKPIQATDSYKEASDIFLTKFEVPEDIPGNIGPRRENALNWLNKFGSGAPNDTSASSSECGSPTSELANFEIKKLDTPLVTSGEKIKPQGIILHWWGNDSGGKDINRLVSDLRGNTSCGSSGCSVQIGITEDGQVYQMTKDLTDKTSHAVGGNSTTIGIEIAGTTDDFGKEGIKKYPQKFEAVVATAQYLKDKYNIPIKGSTTCNSVSGIHPHKALNHCRDSEGNLGTKTDIDDYYFNKVLERIK